MKDSLLKRLEIKFRKKLIKYFHYLIVFHNKKTFIPEIKDHNLTKVLFIRQDRIGDVLVSTPIFTSLKNRYPNIILDILLSKNNYFVLDNEFFIRKRWMYNKKPWDIISLLRNLREEKYDYVIA